MASKPIGVRFPDAEYEEIIALAQRRGCTPSDVIRDGYRASKDADYLIRMIAQRMGMMETSILKRIKEEMKNYRLEIQE